MSNIRDGGVSALAGYLYQIVGVLGMKAWAHCSDASSDSEKLDALLTLTRTAGLHHEHFDQDAVIWQLGIESDDECVFVQFKFSRQTPPPTISPGELLDIVNGLDKSSQRASELGCNVTGYALVTNRQLGDQAEELRQAAKKGVSHPRLKSNEQSTILNQLRIITELHLSEWDVVLRRFGREFGATEQEVEDGINKLIGYVFSQTVKQNGVLVTEANLIEAFTGCQDARPLIPESVVEHSARSINDFPINLPMAPVRRQLLNEITEATSKRALVVLHGLGGCGKPVALCQWAQELTAVSPPGAGAFTTIGLASDAVRFWIAEVICEWGNIFQNPSRRSEQPEHALERLRLANPDLALPIIHLGLDGLDEAIGNADQVNIVKEILRWFWEEDKRLQQELRPPRATLVLTCRDARDLEQKWLRLDVSGYGYRGEPPHKSATFRWRSCYWLRKKLQARLICQSFITELELQFEPQTVIN
jgi:hypothetical protein